MTATEPISLSVRTILKGLCPVCGQGQLFKGLLKLKLVNRCAVCGLDVEHLNVGDGPAAFSTLLVGTLISILALWYEFSFSPAWWAHVLIWPLTTFVVTIVTLRLLKAWLLTAEYRTDCSIGQRADKESLEQK